MSTYTIAGVVGSRRKDSLNRKLFEIIAQRLPEGFEMVELVYDDVPFFDQDLEADPPAPVRRVREQVAQADAVWFVSPEYNHAVPGGLKNLIDWLSRPSVPATTNEISNKLVTFSGISISGNGANIMLDQLDMLLGILNAFIMHQPRTAVPAGHTLLDEEGNLVLTEISVEFLDKQIGAFCRFIETFRQHTK